MPTAIGANTVTSITRHYIMPEITDIIYNSNVFFYRLNAGKKIVPGGTQLEFPIMSSRFTSGGPYRGLQVLSITQADTLRNSVFGWKQHYVPVVIDGRTLLMVDSPLSIANHVRQQMQQASMEMADNLGTGIHSDGSTNPDEITGMQLAVDSTGTYGGIARSAVSQWAAQEDSGTATLTLVALQSLFGSTQGGGRTPSIIMSRKEQFNRYWKLATDKQTIFTEPVARDSQLASLGFDNLLFNGVPWVKDSKTADGPDTSNSLIYMLNEDYWQFIVSPRADFYLEDFQTPIQQDAMVAKLLWAGELVCTNPARQGKMTAVTA